MVNRILAAVIVWLFAIPVFFIVKGIVDTPIVNDKGEIIGTLGTYKDGNTEC